jgi:hypothetical protein
MTHEQGISDILRQNNPFSSNAAGDPREERYPDVPGLGDKVFHGIQALIRFKKNQPTMQCAGAVLGEAGYGKTHLIGRLIDSRNKNVVPYNFAYIYPFIDSHQGFRYLLREIVVNLTTMYKGYTFSQLDALSAITGCRVIQQMEKEAGTEILSVRGCPFEKNPIRILTTRIVPKTILPKIINHGIRFLSHQTPAFTPEFLKVILRYCFFPETRPAAIQWLMGRTIASDQVRLLGVSDRSSKPAESLEEDAQEIILSFDLLFYFHGRPMIVMFDQLENLTDIKQIKTFQKMIFCLGDKSKAMLPIAFFRAQEWTMNFSKQLDDFCSGRFKANMFDLKGCNRKQAYELIRSRLGHALSGIKLPNDLFPFYPDHQDELSQLLNLPEMSPRQVINRANRLLQKILYGKPLEKRCPNLILRKAYKTRYEEILANHEQYPPDKSRLILAMSLYLSNRPANLSCNIAAVNIQPKGDKYVDFTAQVTSKKGKAVPMIIMIDIESHHKSVLASLKRGIIQLKKTPEAKIIYIRDSRCPFHGPKRWKENQQAKTEFERRGGIFILSPIEEISYLYALALLKFDVQAGDITSDTGRALSPDQLGRFIQSEISENPDGIFAKLEQCFLTLKTPDTSFNKNTSFQTIPESGVEDEKITGLATEFLDQSPTKMMKADLLVKKISQKTYIGTDTNHVVSLLGKNRKKFNIFRAKDGILISLKVHQ